MTPGESTQLAGLQHGGVFLGMAIVAIAGSAAFGRTLGSLRVWTIGGCIASAAGPVRPPACRPQRSVLAARIHCLRTRRRKRRVRRGRQLLDDGAGGQRPHIARRRAHGHVGRGAGHRVRAWRIYWRGGDRRDAEAVRRDRACLCERVRSRGHCVPCRGGSGGARRAQRNRDRKISRRSIGESLRELSCPSSKYSMWSWWAAGRPAQPRRTIWRSAAGMSCCSTGQAASSRAAARSPPVAMTEFDIPEDQLVAKVYSARIVSPADREVDMPIDPGGYVGMVDREHFDKWLRVRAAEAGAVRRAGLFERLTRDEDGISIVEYRRRTDGAEPAPLVRIRARSVIGADGAVSAVDEAGDTGRWPNPVCLRLSRNCPLAGEAGSALRRQALRCLLSGRAVARFLRLGVSAWRHNQRWRIRASRSRAQSASCANRPDSMAKPSAAKARRSH